MRTESDFIGSVEIPDDALYGIHSYRAKNNFPDKGRFNLSWYKALGAVKKACYLTIKDFFAQARNKYDLSKTHLKVIPEDILNALIQSSVEVSGGKHFDWFIVPAISGGAGTSINLNINEIIVNRALQLVKKKPGDYRYIHPIEHANLFQSTNDVVPSSLKLAILSFLNQLEEAINELRGSIEILEKENRDKLRIGFTQMQAAVPTSFGRLFSTYADALSRDWWRVSKCFERIKVINLGGSAIGSGITVPRFFIMEVVRYLQKETNLPVTRGENLFDATNNLDSFVEVHSILKAHAVNLEKMVNDMRLLSSDILQEKELSLPKKQTGSSIMPGKVNPVIPEYVISCTQQVYANDQIIAKLAAEGCLELNAYLPLIGNAILNSLELLTGCNQTINENLINGLIVQSDIALKRLLENPAITTALVPVTGYNKAEEIARYMQDYKLNIYQANSELEVLPEEQLQKLLKPENLLKEGFSIKDLIK